MHVGRNQVPEVRIGSLAALAVAQSEGLVEESPGIGVAITPIRIARLVVFGFPRKRGGKQAALNQIDGTHHQHLGLDGIRVDGHDFLNLVDGIVEIAVAHHEIDVDAFVVVGGTSHEVGKVDVVLLAKRHRRIGHGLQVGGVGKHMDEFAIGFLGLTHATQGTRFLAQGIIIQLGSHIQRLHILFEELHGFLVAACVMGQPDQLIAIAQLEFLVAFGVPTLSKYFT